MELTADNLRNPMCNTGTVEELQEVINSELENAYNSELPRNKRFRSFLIKSGINLMRSTPMNINIIKINRIIKSDSYTKLKISYLSHRIFVKKNFLR